MAGRVIKPFPYYGDGITRVDLAIGDERDFGDMTAGLAREGYIAVADAPIAVTDGDDGKSDEDAQHATSELEFRHRQKSGRGRK